MSAEQFVKELYPTAKAEKHKTNGGDVYWLIRIGRATMYFSEGSTKSKAWINAKQIIIDEKTI